MSQNSRANRTHRPAHVLTALTAGRSLRFDEDSGQIYQERVCKVGSVASKWIYKARGSVPGHRLEEKGASSLESAAMRSVLANIPNITPEALRYIPRELGERIWELLVRSELDCFHAWRTFIAAYREEEKGSFNYRRQYILDLANPLNAYIKSITSSIWITYLTLSDIEFTRVELLNISDLTNLGALKIDNHCFTREDTSPGVDDSIVRAWGRAAADTGAFTKLRVLMLRNQPDITGRSLEYLNYFPALTIYNVPGCALSVALDEKAHSMGWGLYTGKHLIKALRKDKKAGRTMVLSMSRIFREAGSLCISNQNISETQRIDSLPVLDFAIGRQANYVWETVCFQRLALALPSENKAGDGLEKEEEPPPTKKRKMRTSKQQSFEDTLLGFG
ncbi:MAG: hypothetical protein M1827_001644 [Pycnora praestabilis]|nr:MAG: hypothetical protein M1827_001644 [Pycnora praestabilis]